MKDSDILVGLEKGKRIKLSIIKAIITVMALSMNYSIVEDTLAEKNFQKINSFIPELSKILISLDGFSIQSLVLFVALFKFYQSHYFCSVDKRIKLSSAILAIIAAYSFLIGNACYIYGDIMLLAMGKVQKIKSIVVWIGYFILFYHFAIRILEIYLEYLRTCKESGISFFNRKNVFWIIMGILVIGWLPILYAYYPAMFMGDSENIIYMAFNYPTGLERGVKALAENVYITNHHPVVYTMMIGVVLKLVRALGGNDNIGIFCCASIQFIFSAMVLAYVCVYCGRDLKKPKLAMGALAFYIFCPWISKYVIMISKDTIFSELLLLFGIQFYKLVKDKYTNRRMLKLILLGISVILFRKNGFYVITLTLVVLTLCYYKEWKRWIACIGVMLLFNIGFLNIFLPALQIPDGSVAEALSIPFQQTARYLVEYGSEVTEEEEDAIDAVLQYNALQASGNICCGYCK